MDSARLGFAFSLGAVCGILSISFSLTWGLWSATHPIGHYINLHATYIAATGMGVLCSLGVNASLRKRIEALESAVNQMSGKK